MPLGCPGLSKFVKERPATARPGSSYGLRPTEDVLQAPLMLQRPISRGRTATYDLEDNLSTPTKTLDSSVYWREEAPLRWVLLFRQTVPHLWDKTLEPQDWKLNDSDPTAENFCKLHCIEDYRGADSTFTFKMVWPTLMDIPNRQIWKQKTNPVASAEAADTPVEGYKAMEVPYTGGDWAGLQLTQHSRCLLKGSSTAPTEDLSWFSLGATKPFWTGMPGPVSALTHEGLCVTVLDCSCAKSFHTGEPSQGLYFSFSKEALVPIFGPEALKKEKLNDTVHSVKQIRDGKVIWSGNIKLFIKEFDISPADEEEEEEGKPEDKEDWSFVHSCGGRRDPPSPEVEPPPPPDPPPKLKKGQKPPPPPPEPDPEPDEWEEGDQVVFLEVTVPSVELWVQEDAKHVPRWFDSHL